MVRFLFNLSYHQLSTVRQIIVKLQKEVPFLLGSLVHSLAKEVKGEILTCRYHIRLTKVEGSPNTVTKGASA